MPEGVSSRYVNIVVTVTVTLCSLRETMPLNVIL